MHPRSVSFFQYLLGEFGLRGQRDAILRFGRRLGAKHLQLLFERVARRAPLGELEQFGRGGRWSGRGTVTGCTAVRCRSGRRSRNAMAVGADAKQTDAVALERHHQQAALAIVPDRGARNQRLGKGGERFETSVCVQVLGG